MSRSDKVRKLMGASAVVALSRGRGAANESISKIKSTGIRK